MPPRRPPVNTPAPAASNIKEVRAKEAQEDRALVERVQAGDKEAFRLLVERHQRRAFSIAMGLLRDENDARELVQDAFLRVYKNIGTFQGQSSFFTWLYRIITNLSIDLIRKPGRQVAELDETRVEGIRCERKIFPSSRVSMDRIQLMWCADGKSLRVSGKRSQPFPITTAVSS